MNFFRGKIIFPSALVWGINNDQSLNDNNSTFQHICKSPVDMNVIRAMLPGSK